MKLNIAKKLDLTKTDCIIEHPGNNLKKHEINRSEINKIKLHFLLFHRLLMDEVKVLLFRKKDANRKNRKKSSKQR